MCTITFKKYLFETGKKTLQVIIYQQSKIYRLSFFYTFLGLCVFATNCVHLYHFRASKGKYAIISIISRILKLLNSPNAIWPSYDSTAAAFPNCVTNRHSACVLTLSHSLVARETEESSGANGHDFRQASEGGRSRPRSWTLYRYTQTHTHTVTLTHTQCNNRQIWLTLPVSYLTSKCFFYAKISSRLYCR